MSVESGLADDEGESASELARDLLDQAAHIFEPRLVDLMLGVDAGRRAVLAEHFAQHLAPLAGGDGSMMLRPSAAADFRSMRAWVTALSSRSRRQAWSAATCSISTDSGTVMMPSMPPASGDGSVSV